MPLAQEHNDSQAQVLAQRLSAATAKTVVEPGEKKSEEQLAKQIFSLHGTALESTAGLDHDDEAGAWQRDIRASTKRSDFDDSDISEVEYRRVQLERVVLVGAYEHDREKAEISLSELAALADTAGAEVMDGVLQKRLKPDPATYIGKGKAQEVADIVADTQADTVIVNASLLPGQRRGLEDVIGVKVIDRTAVILDIFAQHAQSREGKAQVELAQLEYLLPRLRGWGESMSRQAGGRVAGGAGIGSRGPGETKIELDRRRINKRMAKLRREIADMKQSRQTKRSKRGKNQLPAVAIVGYTNAGKSSLLNRLSGAEVMVQDALFATLDTTVRKMRTAGGRHFTLTDTVGFISDLPHELVEAFRSTLEEVSEADLLIHVVDAAHADPEGQILAVNQVLKEIEGDLETAKQIIVFNKDDLLTASARANLRHRFPQALMVSAHKGTGIKELLKEIEDNLPGSEKPVDYLIPYSAAKLISRMHQEGKVEKLEYLAEGIHILGRAPFKLASALQIQALYPKE